ncbi:DUF2946 family protein [Sphingomonas phyllosphaerae]|uniref:DUF2946 family protein n=1 Tax=Sphingomonas phyllosphaerae TaxID=257003 RepID=UPI003FA6C6CD
MTNHLRSPPGLLLLPLLALCSLLYDGVAVRAHQQAAPELVAAQIHSSSASFDDACALCAATATLDALLLPISLDWQVPVAAAIVVTVVTRPSRAAHRRAHDWHSRAPPGSSSPR